MGVLALACGNISTDLNEVIALQVNLGPDTGKMDFGDTVTLTAVALNGRGQAVTAPIIWSDLDTNVHIDSLTGAVTAHNIGTGLIQARTGNLRSNPQSITVFIRPDTAFADSTLARDSVSIGTKTDSLSDSIRVRVRHYDPTDTTSLSLRPVLFSLLYPADTTSFKLFPAGTVLTDVNGLAVVQVRLKQRTLPDSAVVQASVVRYFNHAAVPGSPMTFVVRFYP